jgi:hypothetical protein
MCQGQLLQEKVYSRNHTGTTGYKQNNVGVQLTSYPKSYSKWMGDLRKRVKTGLIMVKHA